MVCNISIVSLLKMKYLCLCLCICRPAAPFPKLQYPLEDHQQENREEENRCLTIAEDLIANYPHKVVGLIIEPVQAEGGDNHATPYFFQQLRKLATKYDITFIVDEVQTGGKFLQVQFCLPFFTVF